MLLSQDAMGDLARTGLRKYWLVTLGAFSLLVVTLTS
jgi:hypothetical protein